MSIRIFSITAWSVNIRRKSDVLCVVAVFFTCCHSTAYMTLRFIDIENNPCLESQARIYLVFITGEIRYHDYFGHESDILMAEIGHYESEQYTKEIFYSIIRDLFPNFALQLSKINTNPIKYL